jgi:hypothetical protein
MSHLRLEALARLVDETPTPDEERHLAGCEDCRLELEAFRDQTAMLGTLPKMLPPPDAWPALRRRLAEEGLTRPVRSRWAGTAALARVAAALVLFVAGGAAGWAARGPDGSATVPGSELAAEGSTPVAVEQPASTPPTLAEGTTAAAPAGGEAFSSALDRYMQASAAPAPDPAARLAALENIVLTTAEALNESPADPVINSYHLTAVAQRNELLRQLAASADDPVF